MRVEKLMNKSLFGRLTFQVIVWSEKRKII